MMQEAGQCLIKVIDLVKSPKLAGPDQILALPTVIRRFPDPIKEIIGDMSDTERVVSGLEMPTY